MEMFEQILRHIGNVLQNTMIPLVHAQQLQNEHPEDDNVWDRIKAITKTNEYGKISPELTNLIAYFESSFIFGGFIGGIIYSKNSYMDFMENSRASQYKFHWDAKADITKRMIDGAIRGACIWGIKCIAISMTFATLVNFIPIVRNKNSWPEFIVSGVVAGTLAGHLLRNPNEMGFQAKQLNGKLTYRQLCLAKGIGFGLLYGTSAGVYSLYKRNRLNANEMKKWEKYWKQRRQGKDVSN